MQQATANLILRLIVLSGAVALGILALTTIGEYGIACIIAGGIVGCALGGK